MATEATWTNVIPTARSWSGQIHGLTILGRLETFIWWLDPKRRRRHGLVHVSRNWRRQRRWRFAGRALFAAGTNVCGADIHDGCSLGWRDPLAGVGGVVWRGVRVGEVAGGYENEAAGLSVWVGGKRRARGRGVWGRRFRGVGERVLARSDAAVCGTDRAGRHWGLGRDWERRRQTKLATLANGGGPMG